MDRYLKKFGSSCVYAGFRNCIPIIMILIIFMTGCAGKDGKNAAITAGTIPSGNMPSVSASLSLFSTEPDTLNPLLTENIYFKTYSSLIYESLVRIDSDQNIIPCLSDSWESSQDLSAWTFHLKKGVLWHGGTGFSAEDVKFTIEFINDLSIVTTYERNMTNIDSVTAPDADTVIIKLKKPSSMTPYMMCFPILSKAQFEGQMKPASLEAIIPEGTGPYRITTYIPAGSISLERNEAWLEKPPVISNITISIYGKTQKEFGHFQDGKSDIIIMRKGEGVKYWMRSDLTVRKYPGRYYEYLSFNMNGPFVSEKHVRQAIANFIDKASLIDDLLPGEALPADLPLVPDTVFSSSAGIIDPVSAAEAREILINAGWVYMDGLMYKPVWGTYQPLKTDMVVYSGNPVRCKVAEKLAKELLQIGIQVRVLKVGWDEIISRIESGYYGIALLGCSLPLEPDLSFMFSSSSVPSGEWHDADYAAAVNTSGYKSAEADAYLDAIASAGTRQDLEFAYGKLCSLLTEEVPYVGLYIYYDTVLYNRKMGGISAPDLWNPLRGFDRWFINDEEE